MERLVVGIDGGGSKTMACCRALGTNVNKGIPIKEATGAAGSTNWNSVGEDAAKTALESCIFESVANYCDRQPGQQPVREDLERIACICLCMSGVDRPQDILRVRQWIAAMLPHLAETEGGELEGNERILVYSDAVAALASGTDGDLYGIVVISGTGMISYGFNKEGTSKRSGGWGPLLGDRGSGHHLGSSALAAVLAAHDGRGPPTALTERVKETLSLTSVDGLIPWAYSGDQSWKRFADLSRLVADCAEQGDEVAVALMHSAAAELAEHIACVAKKLGFSDDTQAEAAPSFPIVFAGGNLTCVDSDGNPRFLAKVLESRLQRDMPNGDVRTPSMEIHAAAAAVANRRIRAAAPVPS